MHGTSILLFALIACAHAFIAGLAAVAVAAGFDLNTAQRAVIFIAAVEIAAFNAAADVPVGFLAHGCFTSFIYLPIGKAYSARSVAKLYLKQGQ